MIDRRAATIAVTLALLPGCLGGDFALLEGGTGAGYVPPATCADGAKNGAETDVDCGGEACSKCAATQKCGANADCETGYCAGGACTPSSCGDGALGGSETDVDCGGGACPPCQDGKACGSPAHCESKRCVGGACALPACDDLIQNGAETTTDCGGGCPCPPGSPCTSGPDCSSGFCELGVCLPSTCVDGARNGTESDVDCGGACPPCAVLQSCAVAADCASGVCTLGKCQAPTCNDGAKNADESGVDCGGPSCSARCEGGEGCQLASDCVSLLCVLGVCAAETCTDGIENGGETSVDCGGGCPCDAGISCSSPSGCKSGVCQGNVCQAPTCADNVTNGGETDEDCGGACAPCGVGETCAADGDCQSLACTAGTCVAATCVDGTHNGAETDVDCGGPACPKCAPGASCEGHADCAGGACEAGVCLPSCSDAVKNQGESDTDCGGPMCLPCGIGETCSSHDDCESHACTGGTCQAATCNDGLKSGDESDIDCGGTCAACDNGETCVFAEDCVSRGCNAGACGPWIRAFGPAYNGDPVFFGARSDGVLVVTSNFQGTVDFGGGPVSADNGTVALLSPLGQLVGIKQLWNGSNFPGPVRFGGGDAMTFAGATYGCDYGGGVIWAAGSLDAYVARYDVAGTHLWAKLYGGTGQEDVKDLALAPNGDVLLAGIFFSPTFDMGNGIVLTNSGQAQFAGFFARVSGVDGTVLWAKAVGDGVDYAAGTGVVVDGSGNVFVSGGFGYSYDLGGACAPMTGGAGMSFVAKLAPDGQCIWSKVLGDGRKGERIALDGAGDVLLAAAVAGGGWTWNLGGADLPLGAQGGYVFGKLTGATGTHVWSRSAPDAMFGGIEPSITADAAGNAVIAGNFNQPTADFGGGALPYSGGLDVFIASYAGQNGGYLDSKRFGAAGDDSASQVAVSPLTGGLLAAGTFQQTVDFGTGPVTAQGPSSAFVLSLGALP